MKMRTKYILSLLIIFSFYRISAQDDRIINIINSVELDSLIKHIEILSGEDSVEISGSKYLIKNRSYDQPGNEIAAEYLFEEINKYGLEVFVQQYSPSGKNIYAIQYGKVYPDEYFIICAHYDAVIDYCADDNASSSAAILETARILSSIETDRSIIYAFWDEEEIGLIGSKFFADNAAKDSMNIIGVINVEMLGWDGDGDRLFDIHVRDIAETYKLSKVISDAVIDYDFQLIPNVIDPGIDLSDHSSFWDHNYSALVFGEAFFGGDGNPNYHLPTDRLDQFDLGYFHSLSKLAACVISYLAFYGISNPVSYIEKDIIHEFALSQNYPNPFNPTTTISFSIPQQTHVSLKVYDILGREVAELVNKEMPTGFYKVDYDASIFASGTYFYTIRTNEFFKTRKMLLLK